MLSFIGQAYNGVRDLLAGPMMVALTWLYHLLAAGGISSWGLTIIVFTLAVKVVFIPLTLQQIKSSRAMQALQPQLKELQKLHGKDKEKLMQEQMRLYKENSVNPMAGCLPMLIQMPIWIGLYQALYLLSANPDFAGRFLWIPNLAQPEPFPILAILTGVSQLAVQRMMMTQNADPQQQAMNQAMQFMPLMYVFISLRVPAGLVLYWVASNLFSVVQQYFITGWGGLIPKGLFATAAPAPAPRLRGQARLDQARSDVRPDTRPDSRPEPKSEPLRPGTPRPQNGLTNGPNGPAPPEATNGRVPSPGSNGTVKKPGTKKRRK